MPPYDSFLISSGQPLCPLLWSISFFLHSANVGQISSPCFSMQHRPQNDTPTGFLENPSTLLEIVFHEIPIHLSNRYPLPEGSAYPTLALFASFRHSFSLATVSRRPAVLFQNSNIHGRTSASIPGWIKNLFSWNLFRWSRLLASLIFLCSFAIRVRSSLNSRVTRGSVSNDSDIVTLPLSKFHNY